MGATYTQCPRCNGTGRVDPSFSAEKQDIARLFEAMEMVDDPREALKLSIQLHHVVDRVVGNIEAGTARGQGDETGS